MTTPTGAASPRTTIVSTITITPEEPTGLFQPSVFAEWVGHLVQIAGLDPAYDHTLQSVEVVDGPRMVMDMQLGRYVEQIVPGGAATLTVVTEAPYVPNYANYVRVTSGAPPARAQIVRADTSEVLVDRGRYPAPLQVNANLAVGDQHYQVTAVSWPNRNPETGSSGAAEDYQLVTVTPIPDQDPVTAPPTVS